MLFRSNGDSHSVGADAVAPYGFANDEGLHWGTPHRHGYRKNVLASFGVRAAEHLKWDWINQGESGSSNDRIIRVTDIFLETASIKNLVILIGWSTSEREEWLIDHTFYQVNASGHDQVPQESQDKYKQWVISQNDHTRQQKTIKWHNRLYAYHKKLKEQGIRHLFFNTYSDFSSISHNQKEWDGCYINPYDKNYTYNQWLRNRGHQTVNPENYHFGKIAHQEWADFLVSHLTQ